MKRRFFSFSGTTSSSCAAGVPDRFEYLNIYSASYSHCFYQLHCVGEVGFGLTREADNNVTGQGQTALAVLDTFDAFQVIRRRVAAPHRFQYSITSGLRRQMNPIAKIRTLFNRGHYIRMEVSRKRCRKFDSFHSGVCNSAKQTRERSGARIAFQTFQRPWADNCSRFVR